jgi:hypothetical protein
LKVVVLCVVLVTARSVVLAGQVYVGPTFGTSLLEHRDTSLSHGPLVDEVTVGRTLLAGVVVDLQFTTHDHLSFEFVIGPYHNDVERYCINTAGAASPCTLTPFKSVSRGIVYGMQYLRTFGGHTWRPYVAGGIGVKAYAYREDFNEPENVSPTFTAAFGAESGQRHPFRVELRTVVVQDNPLLLGKTQIELQARATFLLRTTK